MFTRFISSNLFKKFDKDTNSHAVSILLREIEMQSICLFLFVFVVCLFVCLFAWFNWSDRCIHVFAF